MASANEKVVDLGSYREARRQRMAGARSADVAAAPQQPIPAMVMWVPVWMLVPVPPGLWIHAR